MALCVKITWTAVQYLIKDSYEIANCLAFFSFFPAFVDSTKVHFLFLNFSRVREDYELIYNDS